MSARIYRESWKEIPPARPVTQEHVGNPDLLLSLYGPGRALLKKSHHDEIAGDPYYIWSGRCDGGWAVALRHKRFFISFGEDGRIRWCTKQAGGHRLHPVLKPVDGPWLLSEEAAETSDDWREYEFRPVSLSWRLLDIDSMSVSGTAAAPSLARIDAVGFADLAASGGSDACSRLAWIEVWGTTVERPSVLGA